MLVVESCLNWQLPICQDCQREWWVEGFPEHATYDTFEYYASSYVKYNYYAISVNQMTTF